MKSLLKKSNLNLTKMQQSKRIYRNIETIHLDHNQKTKQQLIAYFTHEKAHHNALKFNCYGKKRKKLRRLLYHQHEILRKLFEQEEAILCQVEGAETVFFFCNDSSPYHTGLYSSNC